MISKFIGQYFVKNKSSKEYVVTVSRNWLEFWSKYSTRTPLKCSIKGCSYESEIGGHVKVKTKNNKDYDYIIPLCKKCNSNTHLYSCYYETKKNSCVIRFNE